jgi:hypothetical protein
MVDGVSNTAAVTAKPMEKAVILFFAILSTETPGEAAAIRHATKVAGLEHLLSEQPRLIIEFAVLGKQS